MKEIEIKKQGAAGLLSIYLDGECMRLPWHGPIEAENQREKGEKHYSVFWDDCGCAAHFFSKEQAEFAVKAINCHTNLVQALLDYVQKQEAEGDPSGLPEYEAGIKALIKAGVIQSSDIKARLKV